VIDGVTALVEHDHVALLRSAALHLEHLMELELLQPRVRQIEGDRDRGHVVG
jgi:hypothetical protein